MKLLFTLWAVVICVVILPVNGQTITEYTLSGDNLASIEVNGGTVAADALVLSTLTAANDVNGTQIIVGLEDSPPSPNSAVMSDLSLTSGLLNVQNTTFTFEQPVRNIPGIDLIVFDWGGFASNDELTITINGITSGVLNPDGSLPSGYSFLQGAPSQRLDGDIFANGSNYSTVAELDALTLTGSGDSTNVTSGVLGIDLDNFNVDANASITEISLTDTDSTTDPTLVAGIAAIPEPQSYALALGLLACLLLVKRHQSVRA